MNDIASRRQFLQAFAAALVAFAVAAPKQLVSRAGGDDLGPLRTKAAERPSNHDPGALRTMAIRVRDEQDRPLPGVDVHASVWEIEPGKNRFPNRDYTTDEMGVAEIEIPRHLLILRIWSSKAGYIPLVVGFEQGTHDEGRLIPDAYPFTLQAGHRLSGLVVDVDGKPIAKARVQVEVEVDESSRGVNPQPVISGWLEDAAMTGEDGRWEITNAPARKKNGDYKFHLQVTHPEFAGDTRWGELQEAQGITTDQLRAGTAKLTLDRGVSLAGTITGPDGQPVTKGLVIWSDRPYTAVGVNETQIDESGRYETKRLAPGKYPITVLAPGFAPERRMIDVQPSQERADFQLDAGHPIKIQIVDQSGKPVPKPMYKLANGAEPKRSIITSIPTCPNRASRATPTNTASTPGTGRRPMPWPTASSPKDTISNR